MGICVKKVFTCLYINVGSACDGVRCPGSQLRSGTFTSHGSLVGLPLLYLSAICRGRLLYGDLLVCVSVLVVKNNRIGFL